MSAGPQVDRLVSTVADRKRDINKATMEKNCEQSRERWDWLVGREFARAQKVSDFLRSGVNCKVASGFCHAVRM